MTQNTEAQTFLLKGYNQAAEDLDRWSKRLIPFYKPLVEKHIKVNNFTSAKQELRLMPESAEKDLLFKTILNAEEASYVRT